MGPPSAPFCRYSGLSLAPAAQSPQRQPGCQRDKGWEGGIMSRRPTEPFSASCGQTREEQPGGDKGGLKTTDGYKYTHTVVFFRNIA